MSENNKVQNNTKEDYRNLVGQMGKKEFTLQKMQEYGFWPKDLPTPYEMKKNETPEEYKHKQGLLNEYKKIIDQIDKLYKDKSEINEKLRSLKKEYDQTWDYDKIRKDIATNIMKESIARRAEVKKQREIEKKQRTDAWQKKKVEEILFIGRGFSNLLHEKGNDNEKLHANGLPIIDDDKKLAEFLDIEYKELRFLVYHRDVVQVDHYNRYAVPKRRGGTRNIAAPKSILKKAQRKILDEILMKFQCEDSAHGFLKGKSVVTGADEHIKQPELLINMDIEEFFPTITFKRVRGLFKSFGYSGYMASLLAMICTYCERMSIEVKGVIKYVKTSERILPQGSPASPMITNILCRKLDKRLNGIASKFGFTYTRYADDMSFSTDCESKQNEGRFCGIVEKILKEEGFNVNKKKTRFLRKNNRQIITGIVVNNEQLGLPRKWIRQLRAAIYNANKLKVEGNLSVEIKQEISGMAAWAKSVNEKRYRKIIVLANEVIN